MADERPTIFALSSGAPPAAIAVVRISGPRTAAALTALAGAIPSPRRAVVRWLADPATSEHLDRALVLWFPGPASATGEDLAELHLHGGRAVVAAVIAVLARQEGLRAAEAGEFTRRAFANGVIDLAEAEGLGDLLMAETEVQRRNAIAVAGGVLSRRVESWRVATLEASARLEAMLDFGDEDDVPADEASIRTRVAMLAGEMRAMLAAPPAERLRDGVRIVLAGPPNAGKSTLFNALAGREAAIVTAIPGTTRDILEAPINLAGQPVLLIDTAGLREGDDPVERIGIDRAGEAVKAADILLWLDPSARAPSCEAHLLRIAPQCDVLAPPAGGYDLALSAVSGEGMDALRQELVTRVAGLMPREAELAINQRQRGEVALALEALELGLGSDDPVLLAEGLRLARNALDRLTGRAGIEDVLDNLFGRFCIGK